MFGRMLNKDPGRDRFVRLYTANHQQMLRLAVQILGPGPKAEDAVHDAFVKLIRHFDQLWEKPEDRISGWLAVVVKNSALDILRKETGDEIWLKYIPSKDGICVITELK